MAVSGADVLDVSSGDIRDADMKSVTFVRQVICGCVCPDILQGDTLPADAVVKAKTLLQHLDGASVGSYTESCGSMYVRRSIAEFISRRDGVQTDPSHVFITADLQRGLMVMLRLLLQSEGQTAVLVPDPAPHTLMPVLWRMGLVPLPYSLPEQSGWSLQWEELERAIRTSPRHCRPRAVYISNPGNPTGHVQNTDSIQHVIRFVAQQQLFLLVDEVEQDTVFGDGSHFLSYRKVLAEMGVAYSQSVQLASFHSLCNGITAECGLRTSYVELVNVDRAVMSYAEVLLTGDLCPPVIGQIALNVMADPPRPGDPSHKRYMQEVACRLDTLKQNVSRSVLFINQLRGFSCSSAPPSGVFLTPHLTLPHAAAQGAGLQYCRKLLETQRVCVGHSVCHREDHKHTHNCCYLRLCVLMSCELLQEVLSRLRVFHLQFLKENEELCDVTSNSDVTAAM